MAQAQSVDEVMTAERERFKEAMANIEERRRALDEEERQLKQNNRAVEAYWAVKEGRPSRSSTSTGATSRVPRGQRSERLLAIIANSDGINRAQILEQMQAKGDKAEESRVSSTLTQLKKTGKIGLNGGLYRAA